MDQTGGLVDDGRNRGYCAGIISSRPPLFAKWSESAQAWKKAKRNRKLGLRRSACTRKLGLQFAQAISEVAHILPGRVAGGAHHGHLIVELLAQGGDLGIHVVAQIG